MTTPQILMQGSKPTSLLSLPHKQICLGAPHPQMIEWRVIRFAMQKLNLTDWTQIHNIIHEWMLTWVPPGNYPSHKIDQLCPSCHQTSKTLEHLLHCNTPSQQKIWQWLYLTFLKLCIKYTIDPHLLPMWWLGLITTNPVNHTVNLYPAEYHPIFLSQTQIRWKQIYYRRISKQWTHYLTMHQPKIDPIQFYAHLIHQVWSYALELWSSCNNDHTTIANHFPANMLTNLQGMYTAWACLPPHTHDHIYNHTQEELLLKPKSYIQNWIQNNQKCIWNKLNILAKQTRIKTQDIWQFFMPC